MGAHHANLSKQNQRLAPTLIGRGGHGIDDDILGFDELMGVCPGRRTAAADIGTNQKQNIYTLLIRKRSAENIPLSEDRGTSGRDLTMMYRVYS